MGKKPLPANASSGDGELHAAARSGELEAVQSICSANPLAVNSRDRHSRTPYPIFVHLLALIISTILSLHIAAWSGHAEVVSYLCKNKADVRAAAMDDMGAIHFAAQKGHLEVVKILVSSGVSAKSYNRKGMTALHYAAQGSNIELVGYLLKKGINKTTRNKAGKSAIDLASNEEIHKLLVEFEFSPGKKNDKGEKVEKEVAEDGDKKAEKGVADNGDEKAEKEVAGDGDETDENLKRKIEEDIEVDKTGTKKSKVPLSHLLAADDDGDEGEEEEG
ncbi:hypothetical protein CASFOL_010970 [Castilleja foliolosa]|uniref:Uncharacterized protein n=1 Tax=Castilleja foliolosa TaxID=1961234 RepID=A0ABD3DY58_9LAMI